MKIIPILTSNNLTTDLDFYQKLGFQIEFSVTEDGINGIARVANGEAKLTLDCPMDGHGRNGCISIGA
jgi:hypothetical protein